MKKFTKIALITALIMLITGGILTAGGILFGASPQAFMNGMERSAEKNDIFNRWFGMSWLDRLTGLDDLEKFGKITGRKEENPGPETGLMKPESAIWTGLRPAKRPALRLQK